MRKEGNLLKYFNQNDYPNAPYPSQENPTATIKSGGCGVCTSANVLAFFGVAGYDPVTLSKVFMQRGARISGGTDMARAAAIIAELGGLAFRTSSTEAELAEHLQSGGIAIANVDGDNGAKGIFSNAGHYINVVGYDAAQPKPIVVFDVGHYGSKFASAYRAQYVAISRDKSGNTVQLTTAAALQIDTNGRTPNYYFFSKKEAKKMTKDEAKALVKEKCGLSDATLQYIADDFRWGDELIVKIAQALK